MSRTTNYADPGSTRLSKKYHDGTVLIDDEPVRINLNELPGQVLYRRVQNTPRNMIRLISGNGPSLPKPSKTFVRSPHLRPDQTPYQWQQREIPRSALRPGTYMHWVGGGCKTSSAIQLADLTGRKILYLTLNQLFATLRGELVQRFNFPIVQFLTAGTAVINPKANVIVCGYHAMAKFRESLAEWLSDSDGSTIIADEAQSIKEWQRERRAVTPEGRSHYAPTWNWSGCAAYLAKHATRRIACSGTPISNYRSEMWSQLDFLEPGCWGFSLDFMKRYCDAVPGRHGGWDSSGTSNNEEFAARLATLRSRVTKEEVKAVLPPFRTELVYLSVKEQTRSLPKNVKDAVKSMARRGKQYQEEAKKIEASLRKRGWVTNYVPTRMTEDWKIMVITGRRLDCTVIGLALKDAIAGMKGVKFWCAHGGEDSDVRDACVEAFNQTNGPAIFVGTYQSFGVGRNLQYTDEVLITMLPDSIEQNEQLLWRFNRPGGTRPCVARFILGEGTSDDTDVSRVLGKFEGLSNTISDDSDADMIRSTLNGDATAQQTLDELLADLRQMTACFTQDEVK